MSTMIVKVVGCGLGVGVDDLVMVGDAVTVWVVVFVGMIMVAVSEALNFAAFVIEGCSEGVFVDVMIGLLLGEDAQN